MSALLFEGLRLLVLELIFRDGGGFSLPTPSLVQLEVYSRITLLNALIAFVRFLLLPLSSLKLQASSLSFQDLFICGTPHEQDTIEARKQ